MPRKDFDLALVLQQTPVQISIGGDKMSKKVERDVEFAFTMNECGCNVILAFSLGQLSVGMSLTREDATRLADLFREFAERCTPCRRN